MRPPRVIADCPCCGETLMMKRDKKGNIIFEKVKA